MNEDLLLHGFCINEAMGRLSLAITIDGERMESKFFDTFKQMEICARQFLLVQAVHEVLDFSQSEIAENFDFPDLLRALSEYTSRQQNREVESNWNTIARFLEVAVEKLDGHVEDDRRRNNSLSETKMFAEQFRRILMLEFVGIWVKTLEHERYRFSDLLNSLSVYSRQQMAKYSPTDRPWGVWEVVAIQIETAAIESERQGDNLP